MLYFWDVAFLNLVYTFVLAQLIQRWLPISKNTERILRFVVASAAAAYFLLYGNYQIFDFVFGKGAFRRNDSMKNYMSPRAAAQTLEITVDLLRRMERAGEITCIRTGGGHRRYDVQSFIDAQSEADITTIGYCRVSGRGQTDDLACQVAFVQRHSPDAEIIKDFGSGINFNRKGLRTLLERVLRGDKLRVIVAHRDRLARFGGEVLQFLVEQNGGEVVVLDKTVYSPEEELRADLLTILHVFSCRLYGLRKYRDQIKEDRDISDTRTESDSS